MMKYTPVARRLSQPMTRAQAAANATQRGSVTTGFTRSNRLVSPASRYAARPKNAECARLTRPVKPTSRSRLMARMEPIIAFPRNCSQKRSPLKATAPKAAAAASRRSRRLIGPRRPARADRAAARAAARPSRRTRWRWQSREGAPCRRCRPGRPAARRRRRPTGRPGRHLRRSEEHTSELQSLAYLVCRLLLEKKKKKKSKNGNEKKQYVHKPTLSLYCLGSSKLISGVVKVTPEKPCNDTRRYYEGQA